jgi:GTP cyclohydrolase I
MRPRAKSGPPSRHIFEHCTESDDLVLVRDIEFSGVCEHHSLPAAASVLRLAWRMIIA